MASARKGWDQLSPAYRRRLGKAGVSERDYASGRSIKAARGHAFTPERPRQAARNPEMYPKYVAKHNIRPDLNMAAVNRIANRIRVSSPNEAAGTVRKAIMRLNPSERIALAQLLGVELSFPLYNQFSPHAKSRVADGWLLAFMTHAGTVVTAEPWLRYVRQTPPGGSRDWVQEHWDGPGVINIAQAEYRRLGSQGVLSDKDIYVNFKSSYAGFFNQNSYPGRVHA